ncbi:MAG: cytochrome c maturation protein CcmE [Flavobacteriales bacterium]|nr:cytochrome c maturation protein CcmE [Flavobacteriales bacterium]
MKKSHIVLILVIAGAIGLAFYSLQSSETYASFREASAHPDKIFHVVGKLNLEKEMVYNPLEDANLFSFYLIDKEGKENRVWLYKTKPQDFEKSEQVVVVGSMKGDGFHAKDVLTKCPSKYSDAQTQEVQ